MSEHRTPRRRFRRRLAVIAVVLATIPAAAIGLALISVNQDALEQINRELLFAVTADVAHQVDREAGDAKTALISIAKTLGDDELEVKARIAAAKRMVAASPALMVVGIYDETGARVDQVRDIGVNLDCPDRLLKTDWPSADAVTPRMLATTATPGGIALPMVMPIPMGSGVTWFAYAPVSLAGLDDALAGLAKDSFDDDPDAVFVVDSDLRVVADSNPQVAPSNTRSDLGVFDQRFEFGGANQFLAFREYVGPHGDMIAAIRSTPSLPFAIVAQIPKARAYRSIARMRVLVFAVVGIAILLAAAIAILLARRLAAPVARLVTYAGELAARRFSARANVATGDELEILGNAMESAATALSASEAQLRDEAAIRTDLGRYLPKQLVDKIVSREQSLELGGERKRVTVLFADVASFSSLIEQLPPDAVVTILNQLFTILTEIVFRHGGTVDKFIGDCVMAFWNAPDDQPDHAARGVAAAIDMMRWLETANEGWRAHYGVTVHLAIGVNTGDVVIGNFGSERRMEYTCIGDAVNLAARLESMARPLQILISEATQAAAGADFNYLHLGPQHIPSRLDPVDIYEVSV